MAVDEQAANSVEEAAKNSKKVKGKDAELGETTKPKSKATVKKAKVKSEEDTVGYVKTAATAPKKTKAPGKKGHKTDEGNGAEAGQAGTEPKKAAGRPRKAKVEDIEKQSPAKETETTGKPALTKNAANTKKPIAKKAKNLEEAEIAEAPTADAPKIRKGHKKADDSKMKSS